MKEYWMAYLGRQFMEKLDKLDMKLDILLEQNIEEQRRDEVMSAEMEAKISDLMTVANRSTDIAASTKTAVESMLALIEQAKNDPAQVQAAVDLLRVNLDNIAATVASTTTGQPVPPVVTA